METFISAGLIALCRFLLRAIFLTGTAGSGKSSLCSALAPWYTDKGSTVATVNLDPGVQDMPYEPDIDIRDFIDINTVMQNYQLGPNGALIMAADLVATRVNDIQESLDSINPDYAIFDTPGQIELFAYRSSGPYIVDNISAEATTMLFLYDATLVSTPTNFISVALLCASIRLRLQVPQISVLSRRDMLGPNLRKVLTWGSDVYKLEEALRQESKYSYELNSLLLRGLSRSGMANELYPVSATTREGLLDLSAIITRQLNQGEENEE